MNCTRMYESMPACHFPALNEHLSKMVEFLNDDFLNYLTKNKVSIMAASFFVGLPYDDPLYIFNYRFDYESYNIKGIYYIKLSDDQMKEMVKLGIKFYPTTNQ